MRSIAHIVSYISHPISIPTLVVIIYFYVFPDYFLHQLIYAKILATAILTIFIPIVFLFILRSLKLITSFKLPHPQERKLPLLFFLFLDLVLINYIFNIYDYKHLFFFFWALLLSGIICFLGLLFNFKISLHSLGISSLCFFLVYLSYNFQLNLSLTIMLLILAIGVVSSARLYVKAHSLAEVITGIVLAISTQLLIPLYFTL